ncbi:O-antigen ligase family protein [Paenibacillus glycanilyticus]|uniref:O-antigen ligase-related domain-containing protein n=1 Tax=Paenibacillus glycanilyticus TaxID=126569 RepID=A0ABQ6G7U2_9BACL|nr:O-antigen ligase family protein [Paenibacillus glycanilyticus]GLX66350.1 hypothetical protein MU1_06940 [Paenibacillus glycanilyticus]
MLAELKARMAGRMLGREEPAFYFKLLGFTMASSSIVFFEPSPFDLLIILTIAIGFMSNIIVIPKNLILPILLVGLFLDTNFIAMAGVTDNEGSSIQFVLITVYLTVLWLGIAGLVVRFQEKALKVIFNGYVAAALITTIPGIFAYFGLLPNSDSLLMFGRVMGFFKDPNVFGPFLVPAALFALYGFEKNSGRAKQLWLIVFSVITIGILLSFSRAAWGNYLIAIFLYLMLPSSTRKQRWSTWSILLALLLPALFWFINQSSVMDLLSNRLSYQNYDNDRFGTQIMALKEVMQRPIGIGPGQSEYFFNYSIHSLYVRILAEYGVAGMTTFLLFIALTTVKSIKNIFNKELRYRSYNIIVTASLLGVLFNSFFVDTLHWRHFWLLLALPWITEGGLKHENRTDHY